MESNYSEGYFDGNYSVLKTDDLKFLELSVADFVSAIENVQKEGKSLAVRPSEYNLYNIIHKLWTINLTNMGLKFIKYRNIKTLKSLLCGLCYIVVLSSILYF